MPYEHETTRSVPGREIHQDTHAYLVVIYNGPCPCVSKLTTNTRRRKNNSSFASPILPLNKHTWPWSVTENRAKKSLIAVSYSYNWRTLIYSSQTRYKKVLMMKLRVPVYCTNRLRSVNIWKYECFNRIGK